MTTKPTVFIVDDDPSVRRGLIRLLKAAGLAAEAFDSAVEVLSSDRLSGPGCIVLDVRMPGMTGLELQTELLGKTCRMPIIFLSAHGDVPMTAGAMKKGAVDFLTKPVDRDDLLTAIQSALEKDASAREEQSAVSSIREELDSLTPREFEIMTYVTAGVLNKQIAAELGIAEDTVKIHRGRMMHKLNLVSVAELVRVCERAGVEPASIR